jgi:hypothetical protein
MAGFVLILIFQRQLLTVYRQTYSMTIDIRTHA